MILYIENNRGSTKKLLELINKFNMVLKATEKSEILHISYSREIKEKVDPTYVYLWARRRVMVNKHIPL